MRVLAGFIVGGGLVLAGLFLLQRALVGPVAEQAVYRFSTCVFGGAEFPVGDLENGRLLRRGLIPVSIRRRFFDAQFHEVTAAERPGRYGAVVRIDLAGRSVYRFITLYRTPQKIAWDATPLLATAQFPQALGLDPAVVGNQARQISECVGNNSVDGYGRAPEETAVLLAGLAEMSPSDPPAVDRTNVVARNEAWWEEMRRRIGLEEKYPYLVDLPAHYDNGQAWPLVLYLHNADERGTDLRLVRESGLAGLVHHGKALPAILVSPQAPSGEEWKTGVLAGLLGEIEAKYRVDRDRIYITGISAGGDGAWNFALAYPERVAAIVPIAGESDPFDAVRLKDIPIWAFHGQEDQSVPVGQSVLMVEAVKRAGGQPHLTIFPRTGHDAWDQAYAMDALYKWLFAQKRGQPEAITPGVAP